MAAGDYTIETLDDRNAEIYGGQLWNRWDFRSLGTRGHIQHNKADSWIPSLGFSIRKDSANKIDLMQNEDEALPFERYVTQLQMGKTLLWNERLFLIGAIQGHGLFNIHSSNETIPTWAHTGRCSVLYRKEEWALWTGVQTGFRPPDLTELFGNRGMLTGNPELLPESARTLDTGIAWEGEFIDLQGSYFWRQAKDDIIEFLNHCLRAKLSEPSAPRCGITR